MRTFLPALFFMLVTPLGGCRTVEVGTSSSAIVYTDDSRREPHQTENARFSAIARSQVAVRIVDWAIDQSEADVQVTYTRTLQQSEGLCEGEAFAEQIAPGSCSATLIDERHLLTAAHCVSDPDECDGSHYWVFGFEAQADGTLAPLSAEDIYTCTQILVSDRAADYAIVELARPVEGRVPVQVRLTQVGLPIGSPLALIGFPSGIPVKVDEGGEVRASIPGASFRATVDAFSSSSGSGVFDDEGRLVGFLQQGGRDYVAAGDCNVVNVVDVPADGGELVAYLDLALAAYCDANSASSLCACDGPCRDMLDAGPEDAGSSTDAGVDAADASSRDVGDGPGPDAGLIRPIDEGGCTAGGKAPGGWSALLFLAWCLAIRRRRATERA